MIEFQPEEKALLMLNEDQSPEEILPLLIVTLPTSVTGYLAVPFCPSINN